MPRPHAVAVLLLAGACSGAEPASVSGLAGCWAFQRTDGVAAPLGALMPDTVRLLAARDSNAAGAGEVSPYPLRLEVRSQRLGAGRDSLRLDAQHVMPWPPDWDRQYARTAWRFGAPHSVTLVFLANMSTGWEFRLRTLGTRSDTLVGRAVMHSDVLSDTLTQVPLRAWRTACRPQAGAAT